MIEPLHIKRTEDTPEVIFDSLGDNFAISGRSLPEDAYSFYKPLIEWMDKYLQSNPSLLTLKISLDYFNSSSGRYILELLACLEDKKEVIRIVWLCEKEDELMIEKGEEFKSLVDLTFEIRQF
jgi:hypothetical protein